MDIRDNDILGTGYPKDIIISDIIQYHWMITALQSDWDETEEEYTSCSIFASPATLLCLSNEAPGFLLLGLSLWMLYFWPYPVWKGDWNYQGQQGIFTSPVCSYNISPIWI